MREPYIIKEAEIAVLLAGIVEHGADPTYERMLDRVECQIEEEEYLDEMIMDMCEGVLKRARECSDDDEAKEQLYELSGILRRLAHHTYRLYIRDGKERTGERFLRIV